MRTAIKLHYWRNALCLLLCFLVFATPVLAIGLSGDSPGSIDPVVIEAGDILGVTPNVRRVVELSNVLQRGGDEAVLRQILVHKSIILRRIVLAYLQVRETSDEIDVALGHTYGAIEKGTRRRDRLVQLCNVANFTQLGVQNTTGAYLRNRKQFLVGDILTCTVAGCSLILSMTSLAASNTGRSKDKVPPSALADLFDLNPPEEARLPSIVERFVNSREPGSTKTRKQEAIERWSEKFGLPAGNKKKLEHLAACPKKGGFGESLALLNNRIVFLYALNALVERLDAELLALLRFLETVPAAPISVSSTEAMSTIADLPAGAAQAAKSLDMEAQVAELLALRRKHGARVSDTHQLRLEILLLEKVLGGALEVRKVVGRIDQEKHHQFDSVLGQLVAKRDRAVLLNNVFNFSQSGILGGIAGRLFLIGAPTAAGDMLNIASGISTGLATLATYQSRGGKRRIDGTPNVLGPMFDLRPPAEYGLSPIVARYLDGVPPGSMGKTTRREELVGSWRQLGLLGGPDNLKKLNRLSNMPSVYDQKVDTISMANNRLRMLFDTRALVQGFDSDLLDLLCAFPESATSSAGTTGGGKTQSQRAGEAAALLNVQDNVEQLVRLRAARSTPDEIVVPTDEQLQNQLVLVRRVLGAALEVRKMAYVLDKELAQEYIAQGPMIAQRKRGIALNNSANFLQSGVLGLVGGGVNYAGLKTASNNISILSGSLSMALSSAALVQQRIGWRHSQPAPNLLGQLLRPGENPGDVRFTPLIWAYLNDVPPGSKNGQTRREQLIEHWKKSRVITINLNNPKNFDKLAASGPNHTRLSETTTLITNRIDMLQDLHTQVETLDSKLVELLQAVD